MNQMLFFLILLGACMAQGPTANLSIAVIGGLGMGPYSIYALARDYVNYMSILPPTVNLSISQFTTNGSDESIATITALDQARAGVNGVVGAAYSSQSTSMQIILRYYKVPQISDSSTSSDLSNKNKYPYFLRTIPPDQLQAQVVLQTILTYQWKHVIFAYTSDTYGVGGRDAFLPLASQNGITVFPISLTVGNTDFSLEAKSANDTKICIIVLFAQQTEGILFVDHLAAFNMTGPNYVRIYTDALAGQITKLSATNVSYFDGSIEIKPHGAIGSLYKEVQAFGMGPDGWNVTGSSAAADPNYAAKLKTLSSTSWYGFDCVYVYALAARKLLDAGVPIENIRGSTYLKALLSIATLGTTGAIAFDGNGDRLGYYDVFNYINNKSVNVGLFTPDSMSINFTSTVYFNGNTTKAPRDMPLNCPCVRGYCFNETTVCVCDSGYSGTFCDTQTLSHTSNTIIIAVVVPIGAAVILGSIAVYVLYQKKRRRLVKHVELNQRSKINREELFLLHQIGRGAMGDVFRATLRGSEVAAKRLIASSMNRDSMENYKLESAMMCTLRHPNIVLFMGSCHDKKTREMFLVMEFMTKGSLHDVLHNKGVSLSFEMQIHIASQAAQGMNFLHQASPPILHRDLKSHNILLDEKWNAKISDFGMTKTKENAKSRVLQSSAYNGQDLGTLYWTAPEVLRGEEASEKSDVYAFGIIIWEMFHRDTPYGAKDPMFVALEVMKTGLRPAIDSSTPSDVSDLMKKCWSQAPEVRPTFAEVVHKLRSISTSSPMYTDGEPNSNVEAPTGVMYMVATEVENTPALWDDIPNEMFDAMEMYIELLREQMQKHKGYEVVYRPHGFIVAFARAENAANWCLETQQELLHAPWSNALLDHPSAKREFGSDGSMIRAGLRVRMALHMGAPDYTLAVESGRMHYFGPVVDKLKIYLTHCSDGELITSPEVAAKMEYLKDKLVTPIWTAPLSRPGIMSSENMEILFQVVPLSLKERLTQQSAPLLTLSSSSSDMHNIGAAVIDIEEPTSAPHVEMPAPRFVIPAKSVQLGERMGRGHMGETFRSIWSNSYAPNSMPQEVAVKVFISQAFDEPTMLKLMNNISHMSKLRHSNIVQVYGAIFEPGHISLVSEFFSRGNLRQILSDPTVQIDGKRKMQILQDIARGMYYLSNQDPKIRSHKDLKSPKLFVSQDWTIKVAGFGLDIIKDAQRTMTSVGAAPWTAPEIWNDAPLHSHEAVSVYAFGIIMWEVLTRQVPFDKRHPIKLCEAVISGERPPIPSTCPPAFSALMQQCWSQDAAARPTYDTIVLELTNRVNL